MNPSQHYETLATQHFRLHFPPTLDSLARRAAGSAERAYGRLSKELHAPRGPIDITLADNTDYSNGFATVFPSDRITLFVRPAALDIGALRYVDDWLDLVVTHELAHIFHLDRTRGWWAVGQAIFGRSPFLFPGLYVPNWLTEGVAVYYETRLTGGGRLAGTDHDAIARAQALGGATPRLSALSSSIPTYPLGNQVYVYGSELMEAITNHATTSDGMRRFVDGVAGGTIPWRLNAHAKRAFGVTFAEAWDQWRDSVSIAAHDRGAVLTDATRPTSSPRAWYQQRIRWLDSTHLIAATADGRDVGAERLFDLTTGTDRWLARRNSLDASSPLPDGRRVFAQLEYLDPYTVLSDLYLETKGRSRRLTTEGRFQHPDARVTSDGRLMIVATQGVPGSSRIAVLTAQGDEDASLLRTIPEHPSPDTLYSEPRWSHDGTRIVASRWMRGGTAELVVFDTAGRELTRLGTARAVVAAPSWSPDDRTIYFTSDRTGRAALYAADVATGALTLIANSATAFTESEVSPDGRRLATFELSGEGNRLTILDLAVASRTPAAPSVLAASRNDPVVATSAPSRSYSAIRSLLPRYWLPAALQSDESATAWGFLTSGTDVLGRHAYQLQTTYDATRHEPSYDVAYSYAGLGVPTLTLTSSAEWDHFGLANSKKQRIGTLGRRKLFTGASFTWQRPRVRTFTSFTLGGDFEWRTFRTYPETLLKTLDASFRREYHYPSVYASIGFSNVRVPALAISFEDGFQASATVRQRWRTDAAQNGSTSAIGVVSAYKALPFAGFAHHVIALRAAAGWADDKAASEFKAGGVSGSTLSIAPGVTLGDGRRTFFVRGFEANAQRGSRALGGSAEYRAPLARPNAGAKLLPLIAQKLSLVLFADAAKSWCPASPSNMATPICAAAGTPEELMASAGAEVQMDATIEYDVPFKFRFGAANPVAGSSYWGGSKPKVFFAVGASF